LADNILQEAFPVWWLRHTLYRWRWGRRFCRMAHGHFPAYEQTQQTSSYHHPSPQSPHRLLPLPLLELLYTLQGADDIRDAHTELVVDDHNLTARNEFLIDQDFKGLTNLFG
jgi:hypothetical protein